MADRAEIMGEIEALETHCRAPLMTVDARSRWISDWCKDLKTFSVEAIEEAFRDWRNSGSTKFPTAGQIVPLIKAKIRQPGDVSAAPRKWEPLSEADYYAASLEDKIRHHRILAERARFDAGPMYLAGATWASGRHLERSEMSDKWRAYQRQADNHAAEAKTLHGKMTSAAEASRMTREHGDAA